MTKTEREVAARLGITSEGYTAAKRGRLSVNTARGAGIRLSPAELEVCARLGNSPADFLLCKARRLLSQASDAGGVAVNASRRGPNSRQAVDEAADEMYASGELVHHKDTVRPENLRAQAQVEMDAYDADPDSDDAWRHLARAIAFLEEAAQLKTPAFIDRQPGVAAESDDEEDETESARTPFTSVHVSRLVGKAIERQLGPLFREVRAEMGLNRSGIATVARPLTAVSSTQEDAAGKLTALELEVCRRLGNSPEQYIRDKARRGLTTR